MYIADNIWLELVEYLEDDHACTCRYGKGKVLWKRCIRCKILQSMNEKPNRMPKYQDHQTLQRALNLLKM
jgi:hypothetical protein